MSLCIMTRANMPWMTVHNLNQQFKLVRQSCRRFSVTTMKFVRTVPPTVEPPPPRKNFRRSIMPDEWHKYIDMYPDFLPEPMNNNHFVVSRMIDDMLQRRSVIDIPTFYVGSILAVTTSDQFSETKRSRFVGICIKRMGRLCTSNFTLRNVIDGMGIEIRYDLYNPLILNIEVLRLEKRLDDDLMYLRDALPEYSTIPEDMKCEIQDFNAEVRVNKTLVKMKPPPWQSRWEMKGYKGIEVFENIPELFAKRAKAIEESPVHSFNTMNDYRTQCTEETMYRICERLHDHEEKVVKKRRESMAKRFLQADQPPNPTLDSKS